MNSFVNKMFEMLLVISIAKMFLVPFTLKWNISFVIGFNEFMGRALAFLTKQSQ